MRNALFIKKKKSQKTKEGVSVKPKTLEQRGANFIFKIPSIFYRFGFLQECLNPTKMDHP